MYTDMLSLLIERGEYEKTPFPKNVRTRIKELDLYECMNRECNLIIPDRSCYKAHGKGGKITLSTNNSNFCFKMMKRVFRHGNTLK
jgi:hypothetical protein